MRDIGSQFLALVGRGNFSHIKDGLGERVILLSGTAFLI